MLTSSRPLLRRAATIGLAVAAVAGLGLTSGQAAQAATPVAFPTHGLFDYQIGGAYTPASATRIVDRDRTASPVSGKYNVCYLNAFQTQPGESGTWPSDLILKNKTTGANFKDADWPDEFILDTSTAAKRTRIAAIVNPWVDGCASSGFQAIEPDNLDTYTRGYEKKAASVLTKEGNVALLQLIADRAHADGLSIAQKNTVEDSAYIKATAGTDFAVAEQCQQYTECDGYTNVYGGKVLEIEYAKKGVTPAAFTKACTARGATASVILRDVEVVTPSKSAYWYKTCANG